MALPDLTEEITETGTYIPRRPRRKQRFVPLEVVRSGWSAGTAGPNFLPRDALKSFDRRKAPAATQALPQVARAGRRGETVGSSLRVTRQRCLSRQNSPSWRQTCVGYCV